MANDFPQTWMLDDDWICERHCWDASVTTPTSFALLSMWCNLHLASQFRILQGDLSFIAIAEKSFKNHRHSKTKNRHRRNFLVATVCFILTFFNSNGKIWAHWVWFPIGTT